MPLRLRSPLARRAALALGPLALASLAAHAAPVVRGADGRLYQDTGSIFSNYVPIADRYAADDLAGIDQAYEAVRLWADIENIYQMPLGFEGRDVDCGTSSARASREMANVLNREGWDVDQMWSTDALTTLSGEFGTGHAISMITSPSGNRYMVDIYSGNVDIFQAELGPDGLYQVQPREQTLVTLEGYYRTIGNNEFKFRKASTDHHFPAWQGPREPKPSKHPGETPEPKEGPPHPTDVVASMDPNDKVGPAGAGPRGFLASVAPVSYVVRFENVATASAPAQEVLVEDALDLAVFDPDRVSLGPVTFGGHTVPVPPNTRRFSTRVDLRPERPMLVQIDASVEPATGKVVWRFASLDPATGALPADPLVGFLPPNATPGEGEGSVALTVGLRDGVASGADLRNGARITFDLNDPIVTPVWANALDLGAPSSRVLPFDDAGGDSLLVVAWEGADADAGVARYDVYVARDGGPFARWRTATTATADTFRAVRGATYGFFARAYDAAGNAEPMKDRAEVTTRVEVAAAPAAGLPAVFALHPPFPNPLVGPGTVRFDAPTAGPVRLALHDALGRTVAVLADGDVPAGRHRAALAPGALAAGVYYLRMQAGAFEATRPLAVVR